MKNKENKQKQLEEKIRELHKLKAGWHNGYGEKVDSDSIKLVIRLINRINNLEVLNLKAFPKLDKGISLEGHFNSQAIFITINNLIKQRKYIYEIEYIETEVFNVMSFESNDIEEIINYINNITKGDKYE